MSCHRILVPTDFSETSQRAASVAFELARQLAAEVHLLHVRILLDDPHLNDEQQQELLSLLSRSDEQTRMALRPRAEHASQVVAHSHLVRGVSAAEAISESCTSLACDLVVMGTHGRRGLQHLLIGSVAEEVVRTAPAPVLTVRLDAITDHQIRQILVPHDFSQHSEVALAEAARWAALLGARLSLLHVVEPLVYPELYAVDLLPERIRQRVEERAGEAMAAAADELPVAATATVCSGPAAETIVEAARQGGHDLVVMGTRGLAAIQHLLLGSVAEHVVRTCPVPVLTIRKPTG